MRQYVLNRAANLPDDPMSRIPDHQKPALILASVIATLRPLKGPEFDAKLREGVALLRRSFGGDPKEMLKRIKVLARKSKAPEPKTVYNAARDFGWIGSND